MINQCILVGKIKAIERKEEDGLTAGTIILEVLRNFPDSNGQYQADLIEVKCWRGIADYINDNFSIGKTIGISGRLEETNDHKSIVIAEKISYL